MIFKKHPLCKSNNEISGIGLKKVIESLPKSIISRTSRNILVSVCEIAASSSEYKLFKSKRRMASEAGVTVATVRRNLDLAVCAGILTQAYVFDEERGQCPTEYQFTKEFLEMARQACDLLISRAKDAAAKLNQLYGEFALRLAAHNKPGMRITQLLKQRVLSRKKKDLAAAPPDQFEPAPPDQNDHQLQDVSYSEKLKTYSPARAGKEILFTVKRLKEAVAERASTKAQDRAELKNLAYQQKGEEIRRTENEVRRRSFLMAQQPKPSQHAARRYTIANSIHDQALERAKADANEAAKNGFNPLSFIDNLRQKLHLQRKGSCSQNHESSFYSDLQEE